MPGTLVKSAVCTLLTPSAPIFHSNVLKNHHKLPLNLLHGYSTQFRKLCSHTQKHPIDMKDAMVADHYYPPWFSIAPMMDWTNNHYRTLARLITKHAWLYTEMIAAETIVYQEDNLDRFLAFSPDQHPIVLQIGGNNLNNLAKATKMANAYGYDEINLNCGCPSAKVAGHGCFGARLMLDPKFVAEAMSVIAANCDVPVSVKCRIGVDDHDSYDELCDFIHTVASQSPTRHFIIHSRKAMLNGISPADNRKIPPLKYEYFFGLLRDFPDLRLTINGGITCIDEVFAARKHGAHGVMVGRAAYQNPWSSLGNVDSAVYGVPGVGASRRQILADYQVYADAVLEKGGRNKPSLRELVKPLLNLFYAEPKNGVWKRNADAALTHCMTMKSFLDETLDTLPDHVLDSLPPSYEYSGEDAFADAQQILPPPYRSEIEEEELCSSKNRLRKTKHQSSVSAKIVSDSFTMASITMTASFLGGLSPACERLPKSTRRGLVVAKASAGVSEEQQVNLKCNSESKNGRRELMYTAAAAAAAVAFSLAGGAAFADEPKNGTAEAKKKYAPVCVSMPTARICRN